MEADNRTDEPFARAIENVEAYKAACDGAATNVEDASNRMNRAATSVGDDADEAFGIADEKIKGFSDDAVVDLDKVIEGIDHLESASTEVDDVAGRFENFMERLGEDDGAVRRYLDGLDDLDSKSKDAGDATDDLSTRFSTFMERLGEDDGAVRRYLDSLDDLDSTTADVGDKSSILSDIFSGIGDIASDLRDRISNLGSVFSDLRDRVGVIGSFFSDLRGRVTGLGGVFSSLKNNVEELGPKLSSLKTWLFGAGSAAKDESEKADKAAKSTKNLGDQANSSGGHLGRFGRILAIVALAATAFAGPLGGLLALGIPTFFTALGAGAEALNNKYAQMVASGQKLTATQSAIYGATKPLVADFAGVKSAFDGVIQSFSKMITKEGPELKQAFSSLVPQIGILGGGVTGFVQILINGLAPVVASVKPVVQQFSLGLQSLASSFSHLFASIDMGQAAQGIHQLFAALSTIVNVLSVLINAFMPFSNALLAAAIPIVNIAAALVQQLQPAITALGALLGPIGNLIAVFVEAFSPMIGTISHVVSVLAAGLVPMITKLTPLIAEAATVIGALLSQALTVVLNAIMPLLPPITKLVAAILQLIIVALVPLIPVVALVAQLIADLMPVLTPIIGAVTAAVQAFIPFGAIIVKASVALAQMILPALMEVIGVLVGIFGPVLNNMYQIASTVFGGLETGIRYTATAFMDFMHFFVDLFTGNIGGAFREIIQAGRNLLDFFGSFFSMLYNVGKDIITGLWKGISSAASWLMGQIKGLGSDIVGGFKSILGILSPSQVMADEIGKYIPAGIAKGMTDNAHLVLKAAKVVATQAVTGAQTGASVGVGVGLTATNALGGTRPQSLQFIMQGNQLMSDRDMQVFVDKMGPQLVNMLQRAGVNIRK